MAYRDTSWSDLLPGAISLLVISLLVGAIFKYARIGAVRGDTARIFAVTQEARGVIAGTTEVWLEGQKVGKVSDVDFRTVAVDTTRRLALELEVKESAMRFLRRTSTGTIRAGGSLIGAQVIYLSAGSDEGPPLRSGDTLWLQSQNDPEDVTSQIALASRDFPHIIENVKTLSAHMEGARGTAGAILGDDAGTRELGIFTSRASALMQRATQGDGTVGLAMRGDLQARVGRVTARADSIQRLLSSGRGNFGRFQRDSTLLREIAAVRAELAIVGALLAESRGTAGRVLHDSAAFIELRRVSREMELLFEDIKRDPLRYLAF